MKTNWIFTIAVAGLVAGTWVSAQTPGISTDKFISGQPGTGAWLRVDQLALQQQVQRQTATGNAALDGSQTWLPVMQEFKALIDNDPELYMLFTQMFEQIPRTPAFLNDPVGNPQVRPSSTVKSVTC